MMTNNENIEQELAMLRAMHDRLVEVEKLLAGLSHATLAALDTKLNQMCSATRSSSDDREHCEWLSGKRAAYETGAIMVSNVLDGQPHDASKPRATG